MVGAREVKRGWPEPSGFVPIEYDDVTGTTVGWEPIAQSPFAKFHAEALGTPNERRTEGTFELIGPKVNGNSERLDGHVLLRHEDAEVLTTRLRPGRAAART